MKKMKITAATDADNFMEKFDTLSEDDKLEFAYTYLTDYEIATENEIELVTDINGYNYETLCDILYVRDGYKDFDQLYDEGSPEIAKMLDLDI